MRTAARFGVRNSRITYARAKKLNALILISFVVSLLVLVIVKERSGESFSIGTSSADEPDELPEQDGEATKLADGPPLTSTKAMPNQLYPDKERPLPGRIDLTFFTTARAIDPPQLTAIRSWLGLGASVVVFADNLSEVVELPGTLALASGLAEPDRLRVFETPLPRSLLGAPRLDLILEAGEYHAKTSWVCLINADIVLPRRFKDLITGPLADKDLMVIGERLDCRTNPAVGPLPKSVNSFEDLEHWSMAPCWPHGSGGKDYFLFKKNFFKRHRLTVPPFWIGKFVWDHWIVNSTRDFAIDLTPSLLVGHFSHEYDWNWRAMRKKTKDQIAAAKAVALRDIAFNAHLINCDDRPAFSCLPYQSTYDVAYQMCENGVIQPTPKRADRLYDQSNTRVRRAIKPKGQEGPSRRIYQTQALSGSSPSYWDEGIHQWAKEHGCGSTMW